MPSLYDFFASIYLMRHLGEKVDADKIFGTIKMKKNVSGHYRCRFYNNIISQSPYPLLKKYQKGLETKIQFKEQIEK